MAKKLTIAQQVSAAKELLHTYTTHTQLREWATANGMDSASAFSKFKKALPSIGLDYDGLKAAVRNGVKNEITAIVDGGGKLSLQQLATKIGGRAWEKVDIKRIYIDRGYTTSKVRTVCYIWFSATTCGITVKVECASQTPQWCASQELQIRDGLVDTLAECMATYNFSPGTDLPEDHPHAVTDTDLERCKFGYVAATVIPTDDIVEQVKRHLSMPPLQLEHNKFFSMDRNGTPYTASLRNSDMGKDYHGVQMREGGLGEVPAMAYVLGGKLLAWYYSEVAHPAIMGMMPAGTKVYETAAGSGQLCFIHFQFRKP